MKFNETRPNEVRSFQNGNPFDDQVDALDRVKAKLFWERPVYASTRQQEGFPFLNFLNFFQTRPRVVVVQTPSRLGLFSHLGQGLLGAPCIRIDSAADMYPILKDSDWFSNERYLIRCG